MCVVPCLQPKGGNQRKGHDQRNGTPTICIPLGEKKVAQSGLEPGAP